jgi:hypothetical protein
VPCVFGLQQGEGSRREYIFSAERQQRKRLIDRDQVVAHWKSHARLSLLVIRKRDPSFSLSS